MYLIIQHNPFLQLAKLNPSKTANHSVSFAGHVKGKLFHPDHLQLTKCNVSSILVISFKDILPLAAEGEMLHVNSYLNLSSMLFIISIQYIPQVSAEDYRLIILKMIGGCKLPDHWYELFFCQ